MDFKITIGILLLIDVVSSFIHDVLPICAHPGLDLGVKSGSLLGTFSAAAYSGALSSCPTLIPHITIVGGAGILPAVLSGPFAPIATIITAGMVGGAIGGAAGSIISCREVGIQNGTHVQIKNSKNEMSYPINNDLRQWEDPLPYTNVFLGNSSFVLKPEELDNFNDPYSQPIATYGNMNDELDISDFLNHGRRRQFYVQNNHKKRTSVDLKKKYILKVIKNRQRQRRKHHFANIKSGRIVGMNKKRIKYFLQNKKFRRVLRKMLHDKKANSVS